jgi:hypothetical protein
MGFAPKAVTMSYKFAFAFAVVLALALVYGCARATPAPQQSVPGARAVSPPAPVDHGAGRGSREPTPRAPHAGEGTAPSTSLPGATGVDLDQDGLDDGVEETIATSYLPFLSTHPLDRCPLSGLVYRAHPHPDDASLVSIVYSRLYQADCGIDGIGGHPGDDEAFGITVDPSVAAPEGIVAIVAISHQGTVCERDTMCGTCAGLDACDLADIDGTGFPVVYSSRDKHGSVVQLNKGCNPLTTCLDRCELASSTTVLPLVNVGEPEHPLVTDLTTQGFINADNGWTDASLYHYDPWGPDAIGTAGVVADDMTDPAFVAPACAGTSTASAP